MTKPSFVKDNRLGEVAEQVVQSILVKSGFPTEKEKDVKLREFYDLKSICSHYKKRFKSEVKFDSYEQKSGNIAIEYYNSKKCSPSGIKITQADLWFTVLHASIWVAKTDILRVYIDNVEPIRDLISIGDGNACIKLYNHSILNDIFYRIDKLSIQEFKETVWKLLNT